MRQLFLYVLTGIFIGVCDLIDTAFGNSISLDSICVLSAFTIITWITYCLHSVGTYGYRTLLCDAKSCLIVSLLTLHTAKAMGFLLPAKVIS